MTVFWKTFWSLRLTELMNWQIRHFVTLEVLSQVNRIIDILLFQLEQKSKWTEDTMVRKMKQNHEPKKPVSYMSPVDGSGNSVANYWQRSGRRLSEELVKGCYDARRKNYEIRNLTESELNFLLEYVCNSWRSFATYNREILPKKAFWIILFTHYHLSFRKD